MSFEELQVIFAKRSAEYAANEQRLATEIAFLKEQQYFERPETLTEDKAYHEALEILITVDGKGKASKLAAFAKACMIFRHHFPGNEKEEVKEINAV